MSKWKMEVRCRRISSNFACKETSTHQILRHAVFASNSRVSSPVGKVIEASLVTYQHEIKLGLDELRYGIKGSAARHMYLPCIGSSMVRLDLGRQRTNKLSSYRGLAYHNEVEHRIWMLTRWHSWSTATILA
jgi:hypothetical protein